MTMYNCKHSGDQYQITKFNTSGEVESSYLCSHHECQCPAGVRPTCRHRQMLPAFLEQGLVNSHLFLDWDNGRRVVDFDGQPATVQSNETIDWKPVEGVTAYNIYEDTIEPDLAPQALTDTYAQTDDTSNIDWDILAEERLGQRPVAPAADVTSNRDLAKQRLHAENYGTKPANSWRRF